MSPRDLVFDYLTNEYYNIHYKYLFDGMGSYLVFVYLKSDSVNKDYNKCLKKYLTSAAAAITPLWVMDMSCLPDGRCFKRSKNIMELKPTTYYETLRLKSKGATSINQIYFSEYPFLLVFRDHVCVDCLVDPKKIKKYLNKASKSKDVKVF